VSRTRLALAVRTNGPPRAIEAAVVAAVHRIDPLIGVRDADDG